MHIDHIAIWTEDLERERDFFVKYFGCSSGRKYINARNGFFSYFITFSSGARIELMKRNDIPVCRGGEAIGLTHLAIEVGSREKVDSMTSRFEKDGFIVKSGPRVTGDGYYESVILDPEGNMIELVGDANGVNG